MPFISPLADGISGVNRDAYTRILWFDEKKNEVIFSVKPQDYASTASENAYLYYYPEQDKVLSKEIATFEFEPGITANIRADRSDRTLTVSRKKAYEDNDIGSSYEAMDFLLLDNIGDVYLSPWRDNENDAFLFSTTIGPSKGKDTLDEIDQNSFILRNAIYIYTINSKSGEAELLNASLPPSRSIEEYDNEIDRASISSHDTTPATIKRISVNGQIVTLEANETLLNTSPSRRLFRVRVNDQIRGIRASEVQGNLVKLTLSKAVKKSDRVSLAYRDAAARDNALGVIQDVAGNDTKTFKARSVVNRTGDTTPSTIKEISVKGQTITLVANESLLNTSPSRRLFRVRVNDQIRGIRAAEVQGKRVKLTLSKAVTKGDRVSLAYRDAAARDNALGVIQDLAGNDVKTFTARSVVNRTGDTTPAQDSQAGGRFIYRMNDVEYGDSHWVTDGQSVNFMVENYKPTVPYSTLNPAISNYLKQGTGSEYTGSRIDEPSNDQFLASYNDKALDDYQKDLHESSGKTYAETSWGTVFTNTTLEGGIALWYTDGTQDGTKQINIFAGDKLSYSEVESLVAKSLDDSGNDSAKLKTNAPITWQAILDSSYIILNSPRPRIVASNKDEVYFTASNPHENISAFKETGDIETLSANRSLYKIAGVDKTPEKIIDVRTKSSGDPDLDILSIQFDSEGNYLYMLAKVNNASEEINGYYIWKRDQIGIQESQYKVEGLEEIQYKLEGMEDNNDRFLDFTSYGEYLYCTTPHVPGYSNLSQLIEINTDTKVARLIGNVDKQTSLVKTDDKIIVSSFFFDSVGYEPAIITKNERSGFLISSPSEKQTVSEINSEVEIRISRFGDAKKGETVYLDLSSDGLKINPLTVFKEAEDDDSLKLDRRFIAVEFKADESAKNIRLGVRDNSVREKSYDYKISLLEGQRNSNELNSGIEFTIIDDDSIERNPVREKELKLGSAISSAVVDTFVQGENQFIILQVDKDGDTEPWLQFVRLVSSPKGKVDTELLLERKSSALNSYDLTYNKATNELHTLEKNIYGGSAVLITSSTSNIIGREQHIPLSRFISEGGNQFFFSLSEDVPAIANNGEILKWNGNLFEDITTSSPLYPFYKTDSGGVYFSSSTEKINIHPHDEDFEPEEIAKSISESAKSNKDAFDISYMATATSQPQLIGSFRSNYLTLIGSTDDESLLLHSYRDTSEHLDSPNAEFIKIEPSRITAVKATAAIPIDVINDNSTGRYVLRSFPLVIDPLHMDPEYPTFYRLPPESVITNNYFRNEFNKYILEESVYWVERTMGNDLSIYTSIGDITSGLTTEFSLTKSDYELTIYRNADFIIDPYDQDEALRSYPLHYTEIDNRGIALSPFIRQLPNNKEVFEDVLKTAASYRERLRVYNILSNIGYTFAFKPEGIKEVQELLKQAQREGGLFFYKKGATDADDAVIEFIDRLSLKSYGFKNERDNGIYAEDFSQVFRDGFILDARGSSQDQKEDFGADQVQGIIYTNGSEILKHYDLADTSNTNIFLLDATATVNQEAPKLLVSPENDFAELWVFDNSQPVAPEQISFKSGYEFIDISKNKDLVSIKIPHWFDQRDPILSFQVHDKNRGDAHVLAVTDFRLGSGTSLPSNSILLRSGGVYISEKAIELAKGKRIFATVKATDLDGLSHSVSLSIHVTKDNFFAANDPGFANTDLDRVQLSKDALMQLEDQNILRFDTLDDKYRDFEWSFIDYSKLDAISRFNIDWSRVNFKEAVKAPTFTLGVVDWKDFSQKRSAYNKILDVFETNRGRFLLARAEKSDFFGLNPEAILGNAGSNRLDGRGGATVMAGRKGDDTYIVDHAKDVVSEVRGAGVDTVKASVSHTLKANVENLVLTGSQDIDGKGNNLNNRISGNAANNVLNGLGGADVILGNHGFDTLIGGLNRDQLTGGSDADTFVYRSTRESKVGSTNRDVITDFKGSEGDRIDLSAIDAFTEKAGKQSFVYIGANPFNGDKGEVRFESKTHILQVNTGFNKNADMEILLEGVTVFSQDFLIL